MNNLVYQFMVINDDVDRRGWRFEGTRSDTYRQVAEISSKSFSDYASKIGAEYKLCTEPYISTERNDWVSLFFEGLRIIYDESFDVYDNILVADCDMIVNTEDNIFNYHTKDVSGVLESDILNIDGGVYAPWDYDQIKFRVMLHKLKQFGCPIVPALPPNSESVLSILNSGLLIWSKEARLSARAKFGSWEEWAYWDENKLDKDTIDMKLDQPFITGQLFKHKFKLNYLPRAWNNRNHNAFEDGAKIIHYGGNGRKLDMIEDYHAGKFQYVKP